MSDIRSDRSTNVDDSHEYSSQSMVESHVDPINVDYDYLQQHSPWILDSLGDPQGEKRRGSSVTVVICKVCNSKIPLVGYDLEEHYIVKCSQCKEATPIRPAPPGERYIRCVCNCLLICRDVATKVACPRLNCQRIITVRSGAANETTTATAPPAGTCRITCVHCQQPFIFNSRSKSLTKCPYCYRISAIKSDYTTKEMRYAFAMAVCYTLVTLIIIIVNAVLNERFEGEPALYIILLGLCGILWIRPVVAYRLKGSQIDHEIAINKRGWGTCARYIRACATEMKTGSSGCNCKEFCSKEFQLKNFFFPITQRKRFIYPQWSGIPLTLWQTWKVILACYFIAWLVISIDRQKKDNPVAPGWKWLIFLTHWTYVAFISYLILSAVNVCLNTLCHSHKRTTVLGVWSLKLQWFLWNIAAPATISVVILYWSLLYPNTPHNHGPSATNCHVHLVNGIMILFDQALHAMPMHWLHIYQPMLYGATYATFTGIYYEANGTDLTNRPAIYVFLNYSTHRKLALGADFAAILVVIPIVWTVLWALHLLRDLIWRTCDPYATDKLPVEPVRAEEKREEEAKEMKVFALSYKPRSNSVSVGV
ncbi:uncharacterized protein LOC129587037 [Paramacrobiotus metropolitanus]|uniref:uncharacterized protein LOC129587037 n=1 Tax=Paramacrobiotus metropolitanus TaxID=2943436 RepID=UPI00244607AA|nr:uncharacterized protein LOC129587037 [Paramacrobiotus metropolitanus]